MKLKLKPADALRWARANIVTVACLVVAVVTLPAMYILGTRWERKLTQRVDADIKKHVSDLASTSVDYVVEPVTPDAPGFTLKAAPNSATTATIKGLLERTASQVGGVRERALEFNRAGKTPLVEGLFPKPENPLDEPGLAETFARAWVPAHEEMVRRHGGGAPPRSEDVEARLKEARDREATATMAARADGKLTPEDEQDIKKRLTGERLAIATARAQELRFYADASSFDGVKPWTDAQPPSLAQAWERQWLLWIHEDIVRAVAKANGEQSLLGAPVKQIERVRVEPMKPAPGPIPDDPTAAVPKDPGASITGRVGPNGLYDIRYVDLLLVVATEQLPAFLEALGATNLLTVVGFEMESLPDADERLRNGFVYTRGGEHLARARLRVESVWLREWTGKHMPVEVRGALGFPDAPAPTPAPGEEPPADAPPPGRAGPKPPGALGEGAQGDKGAGGAGNRKRGDE